jgi:hypothetical protein
MLNPVDYASKRITSIEAEAAKSKTGPRTPEGKHRSSQNALRHGLSGRIVVLPTEDMNIYLKFTKDFIDSLRPASPMEQELAQNIADGYWRLKRVRTTEESLFSLGYSEGQSEFEAEHEDLHAAVTAGKTFRDHSKAFVNLSIYEQRIQRGIEKNTRLLRELQAERKANEPEPAPVAVMPKQPQQPITEFVCSTSEPTVAPTIEPIPLEEDQAA